MSFGNSGATLNVGTLSATFSLNSSGAAGQIAGIQTQTNNLKNSFNQTFNIKVDSAGAVANINKATSALDIFKKGFEFAGGMQALGLLERGIGAVKDALIDTNASIQQSQLKFEAFTGSVQSATTLMTQLENIASHSTFGLAQITEASGQLLAFQVNAKNVPALMAAIQNASAAAGGNMEANFTNLTRVIGELAGGLPLTERQVRQLVTAGVPLGPLADQLGVTVDQLLNTGKTGQVSGDQLVAAFAKVYNDGKLGDFMQKQAGTFNGAMALIKTNLQLASASAFRPFFDEISGIAVKIGELVQTPTFQSWVDNISKAVGAATDVLRTFLGVLAPVAEGVAATFGINTGNLSAEMAAAAKAKPTFSPYDPSLQGGSDTAKQSAADLARQQVDALGNVRSAVASLDEAMGYPNGQKGIQAVVAGLGTLEQSASGETASAIQSVNAALALPEGSIGPKDATKYLGELKNAGNDVAQVVHGLNAEIAVNTQALKDNAEAIAKVNELTPEEQARKTDEMNLDVAKANLELTKPDTSVYDNKILLDQTTLDNMPRLDTSTWDDNIAKAQASLETMQDTDPAAGLKNEIASIQDAMSNLNTDAFDEKINAIRDKLAEPAPDTTGITNQLAGLNAALAGGTISRSAFNSQYGALSLQKQGIETKYTQDTTGLKGQLKLLEQQRSDQALANKETAQADRQRIADLNDQVKVSEAGHKKDMSDLQDYIKAQEKGRSDATKADAKARQDLQDDIKKEGNLRTIALKPYTDAMKVITDAQAHNAALDAEAAAQRKLALAPLEVQRDLLTQTGDTLNAEKTHWSEIGTGIRDATTALGDYLKLGSGSGSGADGGGAKSAAGGNGPGTVGYGAGILTNGLSPYDDPQAKDVPDSPLVTQLKTLKQWLLDNAPDIQKNIHGILDAVTSSVKYDLRAMFDGIDFVKSLAQLMSDFYNHHWEKIPGDLSALGNATLAGSSGGGGTATNDLQGAFGAGTGSGPPAKENWWNAARDDPNNPGSHLDPGVGGFGMDPGLHASDFADAAKVVTNAVGGFFDRVGSGLHSLVGGNAHVQAGDLGGQMQNVDDFVQHIQDQLGDNGGAQEAIQSFKEQIVKEMGDGSDAATAVADAEKSFTDKFGDGGSVPAALTQTGDSATTTLGDGGTVPTVLQILRDNHVPLTVSGLLKAFGQGGDAPNAITGTGDQATKTFGTGGTFDQATTNVASKTGSTFGAGGTMDGHLTAFDAKVGGVLGTGGSGQADMTSFDNHTGSIFGADGSVIGSFTSVLNWLKGEWQTIGADISKPFTDAWPNVLSFFTNLSGGMTWLATNFKLTFTPYGGGGTLSPDDKNAVHAVGHAAGLDGSMPGHWAKVGERGEELMYVPAGASIIPNHLLPGHADGLNLPGIFDALAKSRGGNLTGTAGPFTDTLMANLGQPAIPGLDGGGAALAGAVKDGVYNWLKESSVNIGPLAGGRNTGGGSGFRGMALDAYLAYLGAFGGPLDNESAFNDLMGVGRERNIDPRWFMAIMQTEDGFGTAAGDRLPQYNNYGGMGVRTGGLGFPSPVFATDGGPQPYAAFNSFHDFLEDEASWIAENGTSFAGYQTADAGQGKNAAFAAILAAIPDLGGQAAGPFSSGGFPAVLGNAQGDIGQMFHDNHAWNLWCEQFAEYAGEQSGYPHLGWDTALAHADGVTLNSGIGPPGSTMLWGSGYYRDGHAAISAGDGSVIGTSPQGIQRYDMGNAPDYRGWAPPGLAEGGAFSVPTTVTVGDGGEREFVLPESDLRGIVRSEAGGTTVNMVPNAVVINVGPRDDPRAAGADAWAGFEEKMRGSGRILTR